MIAYYCRAESRAALDSGWPLFFPVALVDAAIVEGGPVWGTWVDFVKSCDTRPGLG